MSGPVEDGTSVGLTCRTRGARPAAWITWYNGSAPFAETPPVDEVALRVSSEEMRERLSPERVNLQKFKIHGPCETANYSLSKSAFL